MKVNNEVRVQLKSQARADIRERFWPTMGAVLLAMIPIVLISIIYEIGSGDLITLMQSSSVSNAELYAALSKMYRYSGIYLIAQLFIGSPLTFGLKQYAVARARRQETSVSQVLCCFTNGRLYLTSIKLSLCIVVRSIGWMLLLCVGIFVLVFLAVLSSVLAFVGMFAYCVLAVYVVVKIRRYDGAYICMIDTPGESVWKATGACAPIFKGHLFELLVFDLSFLLWELLSVITAGIVGIYVNAYTEIAFVHYFDWLCQKDAELDEE